MPRARARPWLRIRAHPPPARHSEDPAERLFLAEMLVHAGDLSAQALRPHLADKWGDLVLQEFRMQAEKEQREGLPVTSFMEGLESEERRATVQLSFVSSVVAPLWVELARLIPELQVRSSRPRPCCLPAPACPCLPLPLRSVHTSAAQS